MSREHNKPVVLLVKCLLLAWLLSVFAPYVCVICAPRLSLAHFENVRVMVFLLGMLIGAGRLGLPVLVVVIGMFWVLRDSYVSASFWWDLSHGISVLASIYWVLALFAGLAFGFRFRLQTQTGA